MTKESDIETYLVKRVKEVGGEIRKVKWIGHNSAPDRRVLLPWDGARDRSCWVELKRPKGKPTMAQYREHMRMRDFGETVYVINSLEQVDNLIRYGYV